MPGSRRFDPCLNTRRVEGATRFTLLLAVFGWAIAAVAGLVYGGAFPSAPSRITFLSVGQGDCSVIQVEGRTILIDAGPSSEYADAGERLVVPALHRLGVRAVDLVLLSHPDMDHLGGLGAIHERFPIGRIVVPACFKAHAALRRYLQERSIPEELVLWVDRSATLRLADTRLELECPTTRPPEDDNDGSMFVRVSSRSRSVVFSGDAPTWVEDEMASRRPDWRADVVYAGHHGSRTATGSRWLSLLRPKTVVISCGRNNRYGHPHPSVLEAIAKSGAAVNRTDVNGDVEASLEPPSLRKGAGGR